jgi:ATP-dependent Clp protease adapter protein ClpS
MQAQCYLLHELTVKLTSDANALHTAVLTVAQGMCGVYPEEHAELYVEQFQRAEPSIYAEMEEE